MAVGVITFFNFLEQNTRGPNLSLILSFVSSPFVGSWGQAAGGRGKARIRLYYSPTCLGS